MNVEAEIALMVTFYASAVIGGGWYVTRKMKRLFPKATTDALPIRRKAIEADPWSRIAASIPETMQDLTTLREHWQRIDRAMDADRLTIEEEALRRTLRVDLPRIADTLEAAMAIAHDEEERQAAAAGALGSVQDLLLILEAQRSTVFAAASSDQKTVGRYLEAKREDFAPSGPLSIDEERTSPTVPARPFAEPCEPRRNMLREMNRTYRVSVNAIIAEQNMVLSTETGDLTA